MRFLNTATALLGAASLTIAAPISQLPDGMPNPDDAQLKLIEQNAHGTLPNTPPPPSISQDTILSLKLIALNELFEVAFFNELYVNVTENKEGYTFENEDSRQVALNALQAIRAQEELHAISANTALSHFGVPPIEPCQYTFPVEDFKSAIGLANAFTDVVLGTLQDVVDLMANSGDHAVARQIASVIGNEGEQNGWFRLVQGKIPSALPFLTTSDLNFAFTAIQSFIVPGSCPNINEIPLTTFEALTIVETPSPKTQDLTFKFAVPENQTSDSYWITYINQQNAPIVEPLTILSNGDGMIKGQALFPYEENLMNGLTIAAVTTSAGPFADAHAVAEATLAGPGLILIN